MGDDRADGGEGAIRRPSDLSSLPPDQRAALEDAYATPVRAYHHFAHALDVLARADEVAAGPGWRRVGDVRMAILYHDAVYQPGSRDSEQRSATLAREHQQRWPAPVDIERVVALIGLTARHGRLQPGDVDDEAALFLDCDMAVLGAAPAVFDAYHRGIAAEYRGHVPGWLFAVERRRFLKALLGRDRIFLSPFFHERLDVAARNNLRRAVTRKQ
jgi:predicted metal-dependent HD superfamily phosphohydrolase